MGLKHNTESYTESYVKKNIVVNKSDNKIYPDKYIDLHNHGYSKKAGCTSEHKASSRK